MKKALSIFLSLFIVFSLFSYSGVYKGEKNLKIIKTSYFDIIYPEECEYTASLLYNNADSIFIDVTSMYGITPNFTLPIVITDNVDLYNAFYTPAPFNRIVLYDTSSTTIDDLSGSFSESFLMTFRHELTHAVTYNMKNGFWDCFSSIFGDVVVPGYFFISSGMAEGAAVASESINGEGRLNNEYAKHFVKQAKIENCFPSFFEVQGSSNTNILSIYYYFNGAFHQYLQNTYGLQKYQELWSRLINLEGIGFEWCFKKTYNTTIRKEWKRFIDSYNIPTNIKSDILSENIVKDFFNKSEKEYSIENKSGSRFSSLFSNEKGLYYTIDFPLYKSSKKLMFIPFEDLNNGKVKGKELFNKQLVETVKPSIDGRFIALTSISTLDDNLTSITEIYDTDCNSFYKVKEDGLKNPSIIKRNDEYFIIGHKYISPVNNLIIKKIVLNDKNKIIDTVDIIREKQNLNVFISDFNDIENGEIAYIKKDKNKWSIVVRSFEREEKEYRIPENMIIKDLSYKEGKLLFSYVKDNTMPRLAIMDLNIESFFFSNVDLNGGVFNPVFIKENNETKIVYKASFYDEDRILEIDENSIIVKDGNIEIVNNSEDKTHYSFDTLKDSKKEEIVSNTDIKSLSKDYKLHKNIYKGVFIPLSLYEGNFIGESIGGNNISSSLPYGLTYASSNPWSNGNDDLFLFTLGYSHLTNSVGFETLLNYGTSTSLLYSTIDLKTEFDKKGFKQSSALLKIGSAFNFARQSSFSIDNSLNVVYGKSNNINVITDDMAIFKFWDKNLFEIASPINDNKAFNISNVLNITYSSLHKNNTGLFEREGVKTSIGFGVAYDSVKGERLLLTSNMAFYIPHLLPIKQRRNLTYNLPLVLSITLFPIQSDYGLTKTKFEKAGYGVIDSNIHTVLFAWDIQDVIPYLEYLYFQKVYVTFGYECTIASYKGTKNGFQPMYIGEYLSNLSNGKSIYLDSIYMQASLELTPNIGVLANSSSIIKIWGRLSYSLNVVPGDKKNLKVSIGVNSKL